MKRNVIWLFVCVLLIFSIAGCQTATTTAPTVSPSPTQTVAPTKESYPAMPAQALPTAGSYPAPGTDVQPTVGAYPGPQGEPTEVAWGDAEQMILTGNVSQVVQNQALEVTLTLKDGQIIKTTAPAADSVQKAITACGDTCKDVSVTTQ
jgi:hypothetical protein